MLLLYRIGGRVGGLCSRSHCGRVRGMNLPRAPRDDRRTVPRHLRDSEHDMSGGAPGSGTRTEDAADSGRRLRIWIYAVLAALIVATSLWFGLAAT